MNNAQRIDAIRDCLTAKFSPTKLEVIDDSHKHIGHAGAKDGRGHFTVIIEAPSFVGLTPIAKQRMIYAALGDMMTTDIHALIIKTN